MAAQTIFIHDCDEIIFFLLDGDYSSLDGCVVNSTTSPEEQQDKLVETLYDSETGGYKFPVLRKFPMEAVRDNLDLVVIQTTFGA